jgi:hypothetical protein
MCNALWTCIHMYVQNLQDGAKAMGHSVYMKH